jgi:hypothetical protein
MTTPTTNSKPWRITSATIDRAVAILEGTEDTYTHVEDGETFVCIGCVAKCLRANWGSRPKPPAIQEDWEALGSIALSVINITRASIRAAPSPWLPDFEPLED